MANGGINVGGIYADLDLNSGNLESGLAQGRKALDAVAREVKTLQSALAAGSISAQDFAARMAELARVEQDLAAKMQAAYAAVGVANGGLNVLNAGMNNAAGAGRNFGVAMMQVGAIIDDVQYGFVGVVNNIGPLVYSLSGSMGVGAAAQVAAVGLFQLYSHWDDLMAAFGDTSAQQDAMRSLEGMADRLKKLKAEAESFSLGDQLAWFLGYNSDAGKAAAALNLEPRVKAMQKAESEAKGMEGFQSEDEKKAARRFKDAIGEAGGIEKLTAELGNKMFQDRGARPFLDTAPKMGGLGVSDAEEYGDLKARSRSGGLSDQERTRMADLEADALTKSMAKAREMIGRGATNADARAGLDGALNPEASDLVSGRKLTAKERKEKADRETDELNRVGREYEAAGRQEEAAKEKAERDQERADKLRLKTNTEAASRAIPGLKEQAEGLATEAKVRGLPMEKVQETLEKAIREKTGMGGDEAAEVAMHVTEAADHAVEEKAARMAMRGGGQDGGEGEDGRRKADHSMSQVFNAGDLARRAQSGVGTGEQDDAKADRKKGLTWQEQQTKYLEAIAAQKVLKLTVT